MEGPVSGRRIKRRTVRNIIVVIVAVCVIVSVIAGIMYVSGMVAEKSREKESVELERAANRIAKEILQPMHGISEQLQQITASPALTELLENGDESSLATEADSIAAKIKPAIKVRLFTPGNYKLDREAKPPLGYASIDLLRKAEMSGSDPGVELHNFGSADAHVVLVKRITSPDGNLVGLLHISLSPESLLQMPEMTGDLNGYAELVQGSGKTRLVLNSAGNKQNRKGQPVSADVYGTQWHLDYWPESGLLIMNSDQGSGGQLQYVIVVIVLLGLLFGLWYLRRHRVAAEPPGESKEGIVYDGAIKAIMQGLHPGLEKLLPNLPGMGQSKPVKPVSRGLDVEDATRVMKPDAVSRPPLKTVTKSSKPIDKKDPASAPATEQALAAEEQTAAKQPATEESLQLSPVIFRAYDIRGVVGKSLTVAGVTEIGRAIGSEALSRQQSTLVVGRDGRISSPELAQALIKGLCATGCTVIDIGLVPTPVLYFATHQLKTGSGVMITGSHNGPKYNGLKIMLGGETLAGDAIQGIKARIDSGDMTSGTGSMKAEEVTAEYLRRATEDIPVALGGAFKLVVDCGNGAAGAIAPQLYKAIGHDVIELYCDIDGNFPNHHPDPSQPENMQALIDKVRETNADLGFAFDGDGDRLGVVDGDGNIIWPDRQLMLFARDVLSRNQGTPIIYDVKCSRHLKTLIEENGGKPLMWKTGHSLIKSKMKEVGAPLAGEMSGHIFFRERWFGFDDAMYAGARLLEILANSKTKPAEIFAELPGGMATPELRIPLAEKYHKKFMQILHKKAAFNDAEISDIDGIRVDFATGWGLIRPSNTSPCLVARFEADDKATLEKIQSEFRKLILAVTPDLKLPF